MSYLPLLNSVRFFNLNCMCLKCYYDVLGISRRATQAEIKSAYYKLSMIYHPDKNQGSKDAAEKFQSINMAYEVLGNFQRRRLYDKGLLIDKKIQQPHSTTHKAVYQKQKPPTTGRTPLYDFDEWARVHYGKSFARRNTAKYEYKQEYDTHSQHKTDQAMIILIILLLICLVVGAAMQDNLDDPKPSNSDSPNEQQKKKK